MNETVKDSIAILWDIENVTPSADSLFVRGLLDYAAELGHMSVAIAYGDWTRGGIRKTAESLSENSFEMIHVPRSRKNSSDMTLSTDAVELIHKYPHIRKLILVAGDADFRPLLVKLRKNGISTIIICDAKSASEDLLLLADEYKDYRDITASAEDDEDEDDDEKKLSFDEAADLVAEAVTYLKNAKKGTSLGAVKVRVKLLNEAFDERNFECSTWKKFVLKLASAGKIKVEGTDKDIFLDVPAAADRRESRMPSAFAALVDSVARLAKRKSDGWVSFSEINQALREAKVDVRKAGYGPFKRFVQAAEKRSLVVTELRDRAWYVRLSDET